MVQKLVHSEGKELELRILELEFGIQVTLSVLYLNKGVDLYEN